MNPKGKASSLYKDWKIGVKAAFTGKSPYGKLSERELASVTRYIGQSRKANGELGTMPVTYKGETHNIRLDSMGDNVGSEFGSSKTLMEFESKFGKGNAAGAMRSLLESERKKWGREIIKWANRSEAQNLFQVWPRMMLGGMLFNSQAFYEMYANNADLDFANDILLADGFEEAFLGVSEVYGSKPVACYDSSKCIDILVQRDGMDTGEAIEHFNFNVTSAYVGEFTPAFLFPFDEEYDCTVVSEGDQYENDYLG